MILLLARKPLMPSTVAGNTLQWGCGGVNLEASRLPTSEVLTGGSGKLWSHYRDHTEERAKPRVNFGQGRYPTNVILTHRTHCVLQGYQLRKSDGHWSYKLPVNGGLYRLGLKNLPDQGNPQADADGKESVPLWDCAANCPAQDLPSADLLRFFRQIQES